MIKDPLLNHFKKLVNAHLDELEDKEATEKEDIKKSILEAESMQKSGYPVGTIREWKGKKYIKIAPGKWRPKYDSNSRGAKMSIAALKRKADKCTSSEELLQLILENRERFSDDNGRPLPFVKELSDYVSGKNDALESGKSKKAEIEKLLKEVNPNGEKDRGFQFGVEDLEHLKNIKKMIDGYEKNPVKESERDFEEAKVRQYGRESKRLQKIYNETGDKSALEGAWKNLDFMNFHQWQIAKLDKVKYSKDFNNLTDALKKGKDFTISTNKYFGDVLVESGKTGKSGFGLKHIIEQRFKKDGKSVDEITAMIPLILDSVRTGKITRETGRTIELQKNGIVAILRREPNDKGTNWILTGFENTDDVKEKNKAEGVIATVIANKDYALERSSFREQVGAITASLDNIPQNDEKSSGISEIRDKYEASKSVTGNKKTVTLPDGTKIKCHYKIVEADAPTASHDEKTFAPSKGFPTTKDGKSVNDRDYQNDADAQESVRKIASNFNSLALESPPIVTKDGIVISGNNRTMSSKLAAKQGTDKAYLQDLHDMADEYGIEPEDLNGFENPRLILETDNEHEGDYTTEEFAKFNRDTKKTMNNVEKAVKLTKTLNAEKIQSIAESLQGYDTMGELYADTKGSQEFVNKLITAGIIGENEKAQYCRTDGTLNDTGKDFCETVLVGCVLNEDNIRKLDGAGGKRIRQKLVRAILPLIENKGTGKEYSFNTELNDAVNIAVTVAKDHEKYPDVKIYLAQGDLFREKKPDAATSRLAEIIHDEGEKAFAQRMKDLGAGLRASASGEQDIFLGGVESKESLLNRFLEIKKSITDILSKLGKREQSASELVASVLSKIS